MIYEDLKGRKVLVTGASSGIGSAAAVLFSEQGCFVGVHYFSTKNGAEKTLEQVKENSKLAPAEAGGMLLCAESFRRQMVCLGSLI